MGKVKNVISVLGAKVTLLFGSHLPHGWEDVTQELITGLNNAKAFLDKPEVVKVEGIFPGVHLLLQDVRHWIAEGVPTLEIALGAEKVAEGITDPVAKADAVMAYVLANLGKLPEEWHGKHWLDVARKVLQAALKVTATEANAMINIIYEKMKG
jgi:hypothetical protein